MIVFALDAGGDLLFQDNRICVPCTSFGAAVATRLRNRLLLFQTAWFLDTSLGVPWYTILGTKPDIPAARAILRRQILSCPGVDRIETLNVSYEGATRSLLVDFVLFAVDGSRIEGLDPLTVNGMEVQPPAAHTLSASTVIGLGVALGSGGSIS
jgi:hypothetical protein